MNVCLAHFDVVRAFRRGGPVATYKATLHRFRDCTLDERGQPVGLSLDEIAARLDDPRPDYAGADEDASADEASLPRSPCSKSARLAEDCDA